MVCELFQNATHYVEDGYEHSVKTKFTPTTALQQRNQGRDHYDVHHTPLQKV